MRLVINVFYSINHRLAIKYMRARALTVLYNLVDPLLSLSSSLPVINRAIFFYAIEKLYPTPKYRVPTLHNSHLAFHTDIGRLVR